RADLHLPPLADRFDEPFAVERLGRRPARPDLALALAAIDRVGSARRGSGLPRAPRTGARADRLLLHAVLVRRRSLPVPRERRPDRSRLRRSDDALSPALSGSRAPRDRPRCARRRGARSTHVATLARLRA